MILAAANILYEDEEIIVCHKPPGIAAQTARLGEADMVSELRNYFRTSYIGLVHRLDQPVEGIMVFARTKRAAAGLSAQSAKGLMNKNYYAVSAVSGETARFAEISQSGRTLVDYLVRNGKHNTSSVTEANTKDAKRAELVYQIVKYQPIERCAVNGKLLPGAEEPGTALLRVALKTGRHHQIRVQLAHAGMPLLGDSKYGSELSKRISREKGITNVALCAYSLSFTHPVTKKKMIFSIEPSGKAFCDFYQ